MSAFSFTDWTSKSSDEQQSIPGISVERGHPANNPDRGVYWSPATAAAALTQHIEGTLTGDDRVASRRMWNALKSLHRQATESPRMIDRAMKPRQEDAYRALGSYNGHLDDPQLEQLTSVFDDVVALQKEAQLNGIDPVQASQRMLQRAASRAVGYDIDDSRIEPEMRPLVESERGQSIVANMNQSVAQLQLLMKDMPLDALDQIEQIGRDTAYTDELREDHRRLNDVLASIPLVINPAGVEPESNFSVRMETQEEAQVMETVVRWVGTQDNQPTNKEVHRAFSAWRDNGTSASPYSQQEESALGMVMTNSDGARRNIGMIAENVPGETPLILLAVGADDELRRSLEAAGRTVVDVTPQADRDGVHLSSRGQDLPANRVELISLSHEQANDPIERSLAVNAMVGRADGVGYIVSPKMNAVEAQAIHLAGTLRKFNLAMAADGSKLESRAKVGPQVEDGPRTIDPNRADGSPKSKSEITRDRQYLALSELRAEARQIDAAADQQRYYTAGHARPHRGVNAVAFETANRYDLANKRNAPDRDLIGEAYRSIPRNTTILTVENPKNAGNNWMAENVTDRRVLFAEASRHLSFAEITGVGLEGERKFARESGMELKIYERPASERRYGMEPIPGRDTRDGPENAGVRRVCLDKPLDWDDPKVRGALIMVQGNASQGAINVSSQAIKVAQEAVMDRAHTALILSDMTPSRETSDMHSAHMIRLATEMGKRTTVLDGRGVEVPLSEARERSAEHARNFSQQQEVSLSEAMTVRPEQGAGRNVPIDVAAKDDLGQLALAALPGMDAARAIRLGHTDVTLREIREDKSPEMKKHLYQMGVPAETRAVINDVQPWQKAMDYAIESMKAADAMGAKLHVPTDRSHPVEQAGGSVRHAVYTIGEHDFANQPIAAFIGNSDRYREAGVALSLSQAQKAAPGAERGAMVDPAETIDRAALRRTIETMAEKGYGIGVTLEEGVSRAVLEEARNVPEAKVVVVAPGNIRAASPQLRASLKSLLEQDRAAVIMPTSIAPHAAPDPKQGEERQPDKYVENRSLMQEVLAKTAKVGIVVASGDKDQSMHIVRHMVENDRPVAAMIPQDMAAAGTDLYSGNMRLLKGAGRTHIESPSLAQATSANAYAEISEESTKMELVGGVYRGNAGTFQSAKLAKMPNARSGHHYSEMGWGAAAHPISSEASVDRFVQKAERGEGALGKYQAPTERELEKRRLERDERTLSRNDSRVAAFAREQFGQTSSLHRSAVERDAGMRIEESGLDDASFARRDSERQAARQAASAGHSMV